MTGAGWVCAIGALYAAAAGAWVVRPHYLHMDAVAYLDIAQRVGQGDWGALVNGHWSPFWPAMLAAAFRLLPEGPATAHGLTVLLSLALVPHVLPLAEDQHPRPAASRLLDGGNGRQHPTERGHVDHAGPAAGQPGPAPGKRAVPGL